MDKRARQAVLALQAALASLLFHFISHNAVVVLMPTLSRKVLKSPDYLMRKVIKYLVF